MPFRIYTILLFAVGTVFAQSGPVVITQPAGGIGAGVATGIGAGGARRPAGPAPTRPEVRPEDKCTIEGTVLNAATNAPLKKATVVLIPDMTGGSTFGPVTPSTSETDGEGKFVLRDIDPGSYRLAVNRTGFVRSGYGARTPNQMGTVLKLSAAQRMKDLEIKLQPHGVITGKVMDEDGEPLANVQIQTLRYTYYQGRRQPMPQGFTQTNDLGEYRVFGLAPGKYMLRATYRNWETMNGVDRSGGPQRPEEGYAAVYYPGTTDAGAATQIEVTSAAEMRGIDIRLQKVKTSRVSGRLNVPAAGRNMTMVQLQPRTDIPDFGPPLMAPVMPDKTTFEIRGVVPGSYYAVARVNQNGRTLIARVPVEVGSTPVEGLELTPEPGTEIKGVIKVVGEGGEPPQNVRISMSPRLMGAMMVGPVANANVKEDLTFTMQDVVPDTYQLSVMGLGGNSYVKSVRVGDQEMLPSQIDLSHGVPGNMEVILSRNGAVIEGTVNSEQDGKPASGAMVALIPNDRERNDLYRVSSTDQSGHFSLKAIRPGEYKIFSFDGVEMGAQADPDFLKQYDSRGEPVSLQENGSQTKQLKLIQVDAK